MRSSLLQEKAPAAGIGSYRGAEAAVAFSNPSAEFEALLSRAGVFEATWSAKIVVTGEDRVRWLNGMVTNNIRDLAPGHGVYSFVLNPQGRVQGDLIAYNRGEYLLLTTDESQAANLIAWFDRYIIMDDVELANVSDKLATLAVQGPQAAEVLRAARFPADLAPLQVLDATWEEIGISVARGASDRFPAYEIWFAPEHTAAVWDALLSAGAQPVGYQALETFRIFQGLPAYGQDIRDRELPQETEQKHALHFAKGCYIGQEIVERIRSRGNVHRTFTGFTLSRQVAPGTKLSKDQKDIGELTSVAQLPSRQYVALGYIRREAVAAGAVFSAGDAVAIPQPIPFEI